MTDTDPTIIESPLSRTVSRDGITVRVLVYRLEHDPKWALEVVNDAGTSTVWDDLFDTDEAAFEAFTQAVAAEGMETFLDNDDEVPAGAVEHHGEALVAAAVDVEAHGDHAAVGSLEHVLGMEALDADPPLDRPHSVNSGTCSSHHGD